MTHRHRVLTAFGQSGEFRDRIAGVKRVLAEHDAAPLVAQAVLARPSDPAVAFAAARAGTSQDPLLARNTNHLS
jgi:hypothetical protein